MRIDKLEFLFTAKKAKKQRERVSSSSSSSSDSESSSDSSSESEESEKESKKKKKKKTKKLKKKKEKKRYLHFIYTDSWTRCLGLLLSFTLLRICRSEVESPEMKEQEEVVTSTVRPEEIPPIPENRFLMRRSPQYQQSKEGEKDLQTKDERQRERFAFTNLANGQIVFIHNGCHINVSSFSSRTMYNSQSGYQRRPVITRSGRKIKGRGQRVCPTHSL